MSGPLEGLRVLDLTRLQPGNYATMIMGDLGADVVKVEEPGRGDYVRWTPPMLAEYSAAHAVLNRNKRSVSLNLKSPKGVELLLKLAADADVLVESFRPGVLGRLGAGYNKLKEVNPGLIYAAITGYGQDGPLRDSVGHDINYIAVSGILGSTGQADGPPVLPSVQIADLSGAMMAVIGVLAAMWRRNKTGEGEFIDVSMLDVSLSWLALHLAPWLAGGPPLERGSGYLNGGYPFYRVYECADGNFISVGALEPQFWKALCEATAMEEFIGEQMAAPERLAEIHAAFEKMFASKSRDEWMQTLAVVEACVAPVNDFNEMKDDPQVDARGMIDSQEVPGYGAFAQLGIPLRLADNPGTLRRAAPGLGEHNEEIYGEVGLSEAEVSALASEGVI